MVEAQRPVAVTLAWADGLISQASKTAPEGVGRARLVEAYRPVAVTLAPAGGLISQAQAPQ